MVQNVFNYITKKIPLLYLQKYKLNVITVNFQKGCFFQNPAGNDRGWRKSVCRGFQSQGREHNPGVSDIPWHAVTG